MEHHKVFPENSLTPIAAKILFALYYTAVVIVCLVSIICMETWVFPPLLMTSAFGIYTYHFTYPFHRLKSMIAFLIMNMVIFGILTLLRWHYPPYFAALSAHFLVGIVIQLFTIAGMMFLLIPANRRIKRKRKCSEPVNGTVVEYKYVNYRSGKNYLPERLELAPKSKKW